MEEFLKILTEQMRCVKARDGVARELADHIKDQAQAYEESGVEHDQAIKMAVHEMGDPVEIGVALDRIHRPQIDWKMILLTFLLSVAGLIVMYLIHGAENPSAFATQCIYTLVGFVAIATIQFVDYSIIGHCGYIAYILMTVALFILNGVLPTFNGRVPAMSMLVYLYLPVFAGILYRSRKGGYGAIIKGVLLTFLTAVFATRLSGSIAVAGNLFLIQILMLIFAIYKRMFRVNKKLTTVIMAVVAILPMVAATLYYSIAGATYQKERLRAFLHPSQYRTTWGYVYTLILEIRNNASFWGTGNSVDYSGIFAYDELIFLQLVCSYGMIVGIVLILLFALFIMRAMKIVRSQKNQLGALVSASCFFVLCVNCCEGILMNLGLWPVTSVSIPFLTYGGSVTLVYAVMIGLLLSVHRYEKVLTGQPGDERPKWRIRVRLERGE